MSVVDDYGRFEADVTVLRARLYPLQLAETTEQMVADWLKECCRAGLMKLYRVGKTMYLELVNFKQRIRTASRFPDPKGRFWRGPARTVRSHDGQMTGICRTEAEADANANAETETKSTSVSAAFPGFRNKQSAKSRAGTAAQPRSVPPASAAPKHPANGHHTAEELALFRLAVQRELGPQASEAEIERRFSELIAPGRPV